MEEPFCFLNALREGYFSDLIIKADTGQQVRVLCTSKQHQLYIIVLLVSSEYNYASVTAMQLYHSHVFLL